MQLCADHWDKLREALKERGLDKYISANAEKAIEAVKEDRPDPLAAATFAIYGNALDFGGLDLLIPDAEGAEKCPICYLKQMAIAEGACDCGNPECTPESRAAGFERWIQHAANEQLERFTGTAQA